MTYVVPEHGSTEYPIQQQPDEWLLSQGCRGIQTVCELRLVGRGITNPDGTPPPWCRLGKIGKEIEEAAAEVSKLERVCPRP